jgi:TRAP transporter TAXI family solute receptor
VPSRRWFFLGLGPWVLGLTLVACSGGSSRFLSIATGGTGGVYYPYGGAVARVISQHIPGVQATAEVTSASVDNLKFLQLGKVDLAFTLADTLAEAVAGRGPFRETGAVGTVRTLAVLYTNYLHVVARAGLGIKTVADLKGRVVSVGSPGSGTELLADRALAAAGIDPRTGITRHALSVAESAGALKDSKVDAFFWSGGLPTASIQDLAATPGMSIAMIGQVDLLPALQREYGAELYRLATIPPGTYRGIDTETHTIGVTNLLVASSSLDEELAFQIVKTMFEQKAALEAGHPEARHLAPPASLTVSPAEFHPGARRYYQANGVK